MNPKALQLLAVVATCLVIATGISRLRQGPPPADGPQQQKKSVASNTQKPEPACTIKRAAFGGTTQTSLLKAMKGKVAHYIVLDHPQDNPMMPFWQRDWLEANYGPVKPAVVGEFSTPDAAIARAATLCRRN
jgi:hypothetical protein